MNIFVSVLSVLVDALVYMYLLCFSRSTDSLLPTHCYNINIRTDLEDIGANIGKTMMTTHWTNPNIPNKQFQTDQKCMLHSPVW